MEIETLSERQAGTYRANTITPEHASLAAALNRAGVSYSIWHDIIRKGQLTESGKLKSYQVDIFIHPNFIVEADGHPIDEERDAWLIADGYEVLHFTNKEIRHDLERCVAKIKEAVET